jgi:hypothetical protein
VVFLVDLGMARITVHYGAGVHQWNLRLEDYMRQLFVSALSLFHLSISEAKISPVAQHWRSALLSSCIPHQDGYRSSIS